MEIEFKDYKFKNKIYNIKFNSKNINGIIGKSLMEIEEIIRLKDKYEGKVLIDKKLLTEPIYQYRRKITILKEKDYLDIQKETIYDLMEYILEQKRIYPKNVQKKINDSIRIVGLDKSIINRNLINLSKSETKLLQIAISLLSNPDILIIEEPFKYLDMKKIKNLMIVLRKMKDQYNKIVIFLSNDTDKMFLNTDSITIFNNEGKIIQGSTKDVFKKVKLLKDNMINIPKIIDFTYNVRENKHIKIEYHQDIRDIIKDIYKHV